MAQRKIETASHLAQNDRGGAIVARRTIKKILHRVKVMSTNPECAIEAKSYNARSAKVAALIE
jgi:hypothetical protein